MSAQGLLYSFPQGTDNRYDLAKSGRFSIDFTRGVLRSEDGSIRKEFQGFQDLKGNVNSLLLFVSDADAEIFIGDNELIADHKLWHMFEGILINQITINFPSNKVPDKFDIAFVASNELYMPYRPDLTLAHTKKDNTITGVQDAFIEILRLHVGCYDNFMFILKNQHGANALAWEVQASNDDVNYFTLKGITFANIAAGDYDFFETNKKHHFYRVRVKNTVGGQAIDAKIFANAIR